MMDVLKDPDWAVEVFEFDIALFPNEASSWLCLAWAHKNMGDTENATRYCRRVLEIDPENETARKILAEIGEAD